MNYVKTLILQSGHFFCIAVRNLHRLEPYIVLCREGVKEGGGGATKSE
jgi:hypothetical protein